MQWIARLSRTHIVIAIIGLLAFISTFAYLQSLDSKIAVAQLRHNIDVGSHIKKSDVRFIHVSSDDQLDEQLITAGYFSAHSIVARSDLDTNDVLTKSNTTRTTSNSGLQSLSIGISLDRANGGDIKKQDVVDIWKTGKESHLVARHVPVRDVKLPSKRLGISTTQSMTIVLAVTPNQASDLSPIVGSSDIMIVLSTGTNSATVNDSSTDQNSQSEDGFTHVDLNKD
jgi:hypothetical protein